MMFQKVCGYIFSIPYIYGIRMSKWIMALPYVHLMIHRVIYRLYFLSILFIADTV